jgi:hypothetical protein
MYERWNQSGLSDPSGARRVLVSRTWWCQVNACVPPLLTSLAYTGGVRAWEQYLLTLVWTLWLICPMYSFVQSTSLLWSFPNLVTSFALSRSESGGAKKQMSTQSSYWPHYLIALTHNQAVIHTLHIATEHDLYICRNTGLKWSSPNSSWQWRICHKNGTSI